MNRYCHGCLGSHPFIRKLGGLICTKCRRIKHEKESGSDSEPDDRGPGVRPHVDVLSGEQPKPETGDPS